MVGKDTFADQTIDYEQALSYREPATCILCRECS